MPPKVVTERYERIPYSTNAIQVTAENIEALSEWAKAPILVDSSGKQYLEVDVRRVLDPKQKNAYVGDWLTKSGSGFKVFQDAAFRRCFRVVERAEHVPAKPEDLRKLQERYAGEKAAEEQSEVKVSTPLEHFHVAGFASDDGVMRRDADLS